MHFSKSTAMFSSPSKVTLTRSTRPRLDVNHGFMQSIIRRQKQSAEYEKREQERLEGVRARALEMNSPSLTKALPVPDSASARMQNRILFKLAVKKDNTERTFDIRTRDATEKLIAHIVEKMKLNDEESKRLLQHIESEKTNCGLRIRFQ